MASYICPDEIFSYFERDEDMERGRIMVVDWIRALPLVPGDWIWAPEHGWLLKTDYGPH